MKTLHLFALISFTLFLTPTILPQTNYCVEPLNSSNLGAVGQNGLYSASSDMGQSWQSVQTGFSGTIYGLCPIDNMTYVSCGQNGTILKSIDGGNTWSTTTIGTNDFAGIGKAGATGLVAVGKSGNIAVSGDLGNTWSSVNAPDNTDLYSICFLSDNTGFAVGSNTTIYRTDDAGNSWQRVLLPAFSIAFNFYAITSLDANTALVVGDDEVVLKTTDGGQSWNLMSFAQQNAHILYGVEYINSNEALAVGSGNYIIKTNDGGATWNPCMVPTQMPVPNLMCVSVYSPKPGLTYCMAVGDFNIFYSSTDNGVTWLSSGSVFAHQVNHQPKNEPKAPLLTKNFPNPFNPTTTISYETSFDANVTLKVYDLLGREVATLYDGFRKAGNYQSKFDGSNLASGVYFYRITAIGGANKYEKVMKMLLNK